MIVALRQIALKAGFPEAVERTFFELEHGIVRLTCCCDNIVDLFTATELNMAAMNGMSCHRLGWCRICGRFYFSAPATATEKPPALTTAARRD